MDVDAFFASVEQVIRPRLKGRPVVVGGTPDVRGCVCSASYEARACGVKTGMSLRQAQKLCPEAVFLPGSYAHYERFSRFVFDLLASFTPLIEAASIDDIYMDMTGCQRLQGTIQDSGRMIQQRILRDIGLSVSMGMASGKVVARIASGLGKPGGLLVVPHGSEGPFLSPLPVRLLPGIGGPTEGRLDEFGIHTIGQLAALPRTLLVQAFGLTGGLLHDRACGRDQTAIYSDRIRKSISRETTFREDTIDQAFIRSVLKYLCERVGMALRLKGLQFKTVAIKIRYGDFEQAVKSRTVRSPVNDTMSLFQEAIHLYRQVFTRRVAIRLIGLSVSNLVSVTRQTDLLDPDAERREQANTGIDAIRARYGFNAIDFGDTMQLRQCYAEDEEGLILKTPSLSR